MPDLDLSPLRTALKEFIPQGRAALLPALHAAQNIYGHLPEPVAAEVAATLKVPLADVHGVIEFYSMFYREPVGKTVARICADPACAMRGADSIIKAACRKAKVMEGDTSADGSITIERSTCLGLCNEGVAVNVTQHVGFSSRTISFTRMTNESLDDIFNGHGREADDYVGGDLRLVTRLCGRRHAATLIDYEANGGMQAVKLLIGKKVEGAKLIEEVKRSGLVGMGGAAFPTGVKWEGCAREAASPKYFVINADESEPGTFKDRILMEGDPNRIIEGAILGAYAIGASKIYFYIRGEYPTAITCVKNAIEECKKAGYIGKDILGSGFDLEIEVRSGAGAYICGEETALFESIEGKRGFPRIKPPYPTTHGLFGKPTVINNVETLAKIPFILSQGAAEFRKNGTEKSPGSKLFCVSGDVKQAGLYEVPFGITLRELLTMAGGVDGNLKSILFGGAAGTFATEKDLDVKLTFEDLRAAKLTLGSGVVMVFNDSRDMKDVVLRLSRFFAHESCGKCYPCQLGTQRQYEIMQRYVEGKPLKADVDRLHDIGWTMTDASLCGLGQTAGSAVLSAMKVFPEMFEV
ncbi:MAG: NAD(P)H-dependent oxidoreductase subunit E [Chloroflexi bacterium]|nr:NAD(P)H-dependent oxidoreductase subunit E [Chloroflexota bacterium]